MRNQPHASSTSRICSFSTIGLVSALWPVPDSDATVELMTELHRSLGHYPPSVALGRAIGRACAGGVRPYAWAPFVHLRLRATALKGRTCPSVHTGQRRSQTYAGSGRGYLIGPRLAWSSRTPSFLAARVLGAALRRDGRWRSINATATDFHRRAPSL